MSDKLISVGFSFSRGQLHLTEGSFQGYSQYQKQFMMIEGMYTEPGRSGSPVLSETRSLVGMLSLEVTTHVNIELLCPHQENPH